MAQTRISPTLLVVALMVACDRLPTPTDAPPPDAIYDGIAIRGDNATAGEIRFVSYLSDAATCEAALWVETVGLCDLRFSPDAAGFADLPTSGTTVDRWTCTYNERSWRFFDGVIHLEANGDAIAIRIDAGQVCSVGFPPGSAPDPTCINDVFLRIDLQLQAGGIDGQLTCTAPASTTEADGRCGPALPGIPCDG